MCQNNSIVNIMSEAAPSEGKDEVDSIHAELHARLEELHALSEATYEVYISECIKFYRKYGFVIVKRTLPLDVCSRVRTFIDEGEEMSSSIRLRKAGKIPAYTGKLLNSVGEHDIVNIVMNMITHSIIKKLISSEYHCIHAIAHKIIPGHRGKAPFLHRDWPSPITTKDGSSIPSCVHVEDDFISCFFFLNSVDGKNGGMTGIVPESHMFGSNDSSLYESLPLYYPKVEEGDCVIFSSRTYHKGTPLPKTAASRYIINTAYGKTFPHERLYSLLDSKTKSSLPKDVLNMLGMLEERGAFSNLRSR